MGRENFEWEEPHSDDAFRQGDVLLSATEPHDPWNGMVAVITADCDIDKRKHRGALTCVPIIPLQTYMIDHIYHGLKSAAVQKLCAASLASLAHDSPEMPGISDTRMRDWISEEGAPHVIKTLTRYKISEANADRVNQIDKLIRSDPRTVAAAVSALAAAKVALGAQKDVDKATAALAKEFASRLNTLPGDTLLLNEVSATHTAGYVAYLRRALEVRDDQVARSYSRLPGGATYVRISRLRAPYVYALTQQFGAVFSAIGLPRDYEEARDTLADRIKTGDY